MLSCDARRKEMARKLTAVAALAVAAVALAAVAAAGPVAAKQRVVIEWTAKGFALTPLSAGAIKSDTGTASFCCWSQRFIVRDGLKIEVNDPEMTLVGKRGTLTVRNRIEWLDVPQGYALFTGAWHVVRGTGDYARIAGGGRVAGITLPGGDSRWRREGFLAPR
jgi:hypothetical protein